MDATSQFMHPVYAIVINGQWRPGIGDPTLWGWVITAGYALAVVCGVWSAIASDRSGNVKNRRFWIIVSVVLVVLGINKQLDLQTWLWLVGREMARKQGWYAYKDVVRPVIAACIVLGGLWSIVVSTRGKQTHAKINVMALLGITFLLLFVTIRALSIHQLDEILGQEIANASFYTLLEFGGILLVGVSAFTTGPQAFLRDKNAEDLSDETRRDPDERG